MPRGRTNALRALSVMLLLIAYAGVAEARAHQPPPSQVRVIRCESQGHRHTYCRTRTFGRVRLNRRLSDAPCREYYTWGADHDGSGLWVREGCRADFVVVPWDDRPPRPSGPAPGAGPGYGPGPGREYRLTCQSDRFRPTYCPLPRWGRIRLEKRLSDAPCRQYDTWGNDGGGIWVDRGCAAIFSVFVR